MFDIIESFLPNVFISLECNATDYSNAVDSLVFLKDGTSNTNIHGFQG